MSALSFQSPWGTCWVEFSGDEMTGVVLPGGRPSGPEVAAAPPGVEDWRDRIAAFLSGVGEWPDGARLADRASTRFVGDVYRAVCGIPPGETRTYAQVAAAVGRPGAARAVGAAMAANRFAPAIPCHRVVGSDGSLRGYAGGMEMKLGLLEMEKAQ